MQRWSLPVIESAAAFRPANHPTTHAKIDGPADGNSPCGRDIFMPTEWRALSATLGVSEREFQILQFVFDDRTKSEVAEELGISAHTVHTYLGRLYRKLGVCSREQLIVRVVREYLRVVRPR